MAVAPGTAVEPAEVVSVEDENALILLPAESSAPAAQKLEFEPHELKYIFELAVSPQFIHRRQNPPAKKGGVHASWHWIFEQMMERWPKERAAWSAFVDNWEGGKRIKVKVGKLVSYYETKLPNAYKDKKSGGKDKQKAKAMESKIRANAPVHYECGFWDEFVSYLATLQGSNPQYTSESN